VTVDNWGDLPVPGGASIAAEARPDIRLKASWSIRDAYASLRRAAGRAPSARAAADEGPTLRRATSSVDKPGRAR
jgi:hypothetical protein